MGEATTFINGRIFSLEREGECFTAMEVGRDGRITRLYADGENRPRATREIDLGGKTVVPAFIDAHTHFISKVGLAALGIPLSRLEGNALVPDSLDGVRELLVRRTEERGPGLVMGFGLCTGAVAERRLPRASELDSWLPGRSVAIISLDGHSSSYSSRALAELGLASIAEDGLLHGEAHEFNMGKVTAWAMHSLSLGSLLRGLSEATAEAIGGGLSTLHCLEGTDDSVVDQAVRIMTLVGPRLPLRLRLWLQYTELSRAERHTKLLARKRVGGCLAWEMDGSVSSRSAAMDKPYLDRPHAGRLYRSPEEAYALVAPFCGAGWQTTAHAIGPRGIESILSAYERVLGKAGDVANGRRLRIDHFEFPRPDQIERAGRRRMVLAVQPGFAWLDERLVHSYDEALSPAVKMAQCPLRDLIDAGCVVALSTDAPVQPLNPFIQIAGAVGHPNTAQAISVYEALRAYSWAGAYSIFEEDERGSLAVGKYADFAALDRDPFQSAASDLATIGVVGTWIEGKRVVAPAHGTAEFAAKLLTSTARKM